MIVRPANKICKLEALYGWPVATCKHSVHPDFKQQAMIEDKKHSVPLFYLSSKKTAVEFRTFYLEEKRSIGYIGSWGWVRWRS